MALAPASARGDEALTLAGQKSAGRLVRVSAAGVEVRRPDGGIAQLPARELAAVELSRGPLLPADAKYDEFELTDGSTFRAVRVLVKGAKVVADPLPLTDGPPAPTVELPLKAVYWLMRNAHDPKNRQDWAKVLAGRGKRDLLVSRGAAGLQPLPGTVIEGSAAGDRVTFELENGTRSNLPLTRASGGLVFNQPPANNPPPAVCRATDAFGNTWAAATVELPGDGLTVTTPAGAVVRYPDRSAVRTLDFGRGNVAYLSDLALEPDYPPPERIGPLAEQFPYSPRVALDGELRLPGRTFDKGVAVPPDVVIGAPVADGFRTFRAVVGLPESAPADAALTLKIDADGRPLFDATVKAGDPPREVSLPVADARRLRIAVGRGPLWAGSALLLGDARLQK